MSVPSPGEHVAEVMTDPSDRPDPECAWCQQALVEGEWAAWGVTDRFGADEGEGRS